MTTPAGIDLAINNPYGLALKSRVMTAAGCFGYGVEYARMVDIERIGAIVTRSTTLRSTRGAAPARLIETPAGLLSVGEWPNPGLERALDRYAATWARWTTPVLLSVVGDAPDDYRALAAAIEGVEGIAGLELNLAPHPAQAARIVAGVRGATLLPLLAKLPPPDACREGLAALARSVVSAGADALTVALWPHGRSADPRSGEIVSGNLSGPALRPLALAAVADVAAAVEAPVVGGGGIASTGDARQFLAAGAAAVQVGTSLLADPWLAVRIAEALYNGRE